MGILVGYGGIVVQVNRSVIGRQAIVKCRGSVLALLDPVDDPGVFLAPVHSGLHSGLQKGVQHLVLLQGVRVNALEAAQRQLGHSVAEVRLWLGHPGTFQRCNCKSKE